MIPQRNSYTFSDDMLLGIYDADGSVLFNTTFRNNSLLRNTLGFQVIYSLGQSTSKVETVQKFAEKFGGTVPRTECRMNQSSPAGQKVRQFLLKNTPKHPDRRYDFLISEQVIPFLKLQTKMTPVQQITVAYLISKKSVLQNKGTSYEYFNKCCLHVLATKAEIQQGILIAKEIMAKIDKEIQLYYETLPTMEMSDDYVIGAHCGDGSFYVALSWKPTEKSHRLRCEPEWAISGYKKPYCQAFANKYGGVTKPVDSEGQIKFVLSGIRKCSTIVPLFENAPWMPNYKQEQFERWKASLTLLNNQEHFTQEGIVRLLDLTYGLAEKGGRKYSKEQYLEWGLAWLNKSSRQKRKPRGKMEP
jgi:hypothetical protein